MQAFDEAIKLGFDMHLLDIGGGFAGGAFDSEGRVQLGGVPDAVNAALALHFSDPQIKVYSCCLSNQVLCNAAALALQYKLILSVYKARGSCLSKLRSSRALFS